MPDPQHNQLGTLTLLLFHGTGGNEDDLIQVGQMICPSASSLSPRGEVLENRMSRFSRELQMACLIWKICSLELNNWLILLKKHHTYAILI